jgi:tryptophan-rich sensory protein
MTVKNTLTKGFTLIFSVGVSLLVGSLGAYHTLPGAIIWYADPKLQKAAFSLPIDVFSLIWMVSFVLMGFTLYLILQSGIRKREVTPGFLLFALQILLLIGWSYAFFWMHSIFLAFMGIIAVWAILLSTMIQIFRFSVIGGLPLIPYFFWICYLVYLNYGIMVLNNLTFVV